MSVRVIVGREVLGKSRLARQEVNVPEWGGAVLLRELSSGEIAQVRALAKTSDVQAVDANAIGAFERLLVEYGWIDAEGNRVLADGEAALLKSESARIVNLLATKVAEMSGLNPAAVADAKKN